MTNMGIGLSDTLNLLGIESIQNFLESPKTTYYIQKQQVWASGLKWDPDPAHRRYSRWIKPMDFLSQKLSCQ